MHYFVICIQRISQDRSKSNMNIFAQKADYKINTIYKFIFGKEGISRTEEEIAPRLAASPDGSRLFTVFISVCDTNERASVFRYTADSLEAAWDGCRSAVCKFANTRSYDCVWVKADYICSSEKRSLDDVINEINSSYGQYFRKGISFDDSYQSAVTEAELNGNDLIAYKKKTIEFARINKYISAHCGKTLLAMPEEVITFECRSFFCDENTKVYELYGAGYNCGRRKLRFMDKQLAFDVISSSSEYLSFQIDLDGKFDYGFYPIDYKLIPGYNILRHSSSIWSLICAYRLTKDSFTLNQINKAVGYMISNMEYKYDRPEGAENTAFLIEKRSNEIKLGANAVAVILLTEYMKHMNTDKFTKVTVSLGNGILEMLDQSSGEYFHVLNYPSCTPKEKYRTVYYDGEATFALCRLYSLTKDEKWLNAAKKAVDHFIKADYVKYRDHWVAYAMNELTMYAPEERYFEFALRNAQENLKRIYNQKTTYHTYLELLMVTFELYRRITENGYKVKYLEKFDVDFFVRTIFHRAHFMLNGYFYPEYAMYMKYPGQIKNTFFVRHDRYRMRIDDIQHFCGAYFSFYNNYDALMELVNKMNIDINEKD